MALTLSLREEHTRLLPHVEQLRFAADAVGETSDEEVRDRLDESLQFLHEHLLPHARVEEEVLYPVVAEVLGAPDATETMRRDHAEAVRLVLVLEAWRARIDGRPTDLNDRRELRAALYGLYAILRLHFHKEEDVYLPLLERRLSPDRAEEVFSAIHAADAG